MWVTILGILNGALDVASRLLSVFHDSQERKAGRDEAELARAAEALTQMEKANEIDNRPLVSDPTELLERLRKSSGLSERDLGGTDQAPR
jgi:hypothetical protein